jgi:hypothetical protein
MILMEKTLSVSVFAPKNTAMTFLGSGFNATIVKHGSILQVDVSPSLKRKRRTLELGYAGVVETTYAVITKNKARISHTNAQTRSAASLPLKFCQEIQLRWKNMLGLA